MGKCLITKLNGVTNNDSLLAIGEMRVKFYKETNPTKRSRTLRIGTSGQITLKVVGDGNFTDENLTANLGKSVVVSNEIKSVYVSNSDIELSISDKYNFYSISDVLVSPDNALVDINREINTDDLKYCKNITHIGFQKTKVVGNIDAFSNLAKMVSLTVESTGLVGDIKDLGSLTSLSALNLQNSSVFGNIASLSSLSLLSTISLNGTKVTGDVSSLAGLKKVSSMNLPNVFGTIDSLKGCAELTSLMFYTSNLTGDIAVLPGKTSYLYLGDSKKSTFSWSSRNTSAKIIAIFGSPKINNIDKMLQDQAACIKGIDTSSDIYHKTISATGTRTSASDDAVQTLQSKGYTVSITPA